MISRIKGIFFSLKYANNIKAISVGEKHKLLLRMELTYK